MSRYKSVNNIPVLKLGEDSSSSPNPICDFFFRADPKAVPGWSPGGSCPPNTRHGTQQGVAVFEGRWRTQGPLEQTSWCMVVACSPPSRGLLTRALVRHSSSLWLGTFLVLALLPLPLQTPQVHEKTGSVCGSLVVRSFQLACIIWPLPGAVLRRCQPK